MAQAITISISAISSRINATPQAVKRHLKKLNIDPIGFADIKKTRPLYSGNVLKRMRGCKLRKKPVEKAFIQSVRFTTGEHKKLQATSKKYGISIGKILRQSAFKKTITPEPVRQIKVADPILLRQLSSIGNNINQIARTLNQARKAGIISSSLVTACYSTLADIDEQMSYLS